jgi:ribosomal protein S18 acetylase RimI-like enzyme
MEILKINPQVDQDQVLAIAEIYQKTFGEAPWNERWSIETILSDFNTEMAKPGSVCLSANKDGKIVGFTWGYEMISSVESDQHLEATGLSEVCPKTFFYLDEVAVSSEFQSQGIGKKMVEEIIRHQSSKTIIIRTLNGSQMYNLTSSMGGKIISYAPKNRIIMQLCL